MKLARLFSTSLLAPLCTCFLGIAATPALAANPPTASVVLIDGDMREDWPDRGVVAIHRNHSSGALTLNYSIAGTAVAAQDYTTTAAGTITLADGQREGWLEFAPTGQTFSTPARTITVTLLPGTGYDLSTEAGEQTATVTIGPASPLPSQKAAVRFLLQAAFGPSGDLRNVTEVMKKGYDRWITEQFAKPVGLQQPYLNTLNRLTHGHVYADSKVFSWWARAMSPAVTADPLRQRVGFALSEIFVIGDHNDELANQPIGMTNYYDMLLKGAFGNYRDLLYNVGTHPCMGVFLSHLQNEKGDPEAGTFADENYAREVMQLFSIGLWELNLDGTRKLDNQGQPIPTYSNTTIANMAKVMTGFSFGGRKAKGFWWAPDNFTTPMRMWDEYHDMTAKTLLNGVSLPARTPSDPDLGTAGLADYNAAIDCLFHHPNVAPFISKQLIQRLVTSNPTPEYVARVAGKFVDNGKGVRGDLKAVIRAILLDPEARDPLVAQGDTFGKLREPYLRTANLMRALNARAANGSYQLNYLEEVHFQQPLSSPSVFNFFKPGYAPAGPIADASLVAPEFQIVNAVTAMSVPNYYLSALRYGFNRWGSDNPRAVVKGDYRKYLAQVEDVPAMMRRLDLLLTGGTLPNEQHQIIREAVEKIRDNMWEWERERVRMAIYLIATAPEAAVLR
jgi:uncharacterized protein (DUF1800 family)